MKKVFFSGLSPTISEEQLKEALVRFAPLGEISIIRDGNPQEVVAIVEMYLSDQAAFDLPARVVNLWPGHQHVSAWIMRF